MARGPLIVIEDDLDTRMLAAQIADDFGIDMIECEDLASGRKAMDEHPDAPVITDHDLPDGKGADLLQLDREVVVFTGHDLDGTVGKPTDALVFERALELLIDAVAPMQPVDADVLAESAGRFPGGPERHGMFLERLAASQAETCKELQSGEPERIARACHNASPSIGIVGCIGLAATLRRLEVATRDGINTAPIAALVGRRLRHIQWPMLANA